MPLKALEELIRNGEDVSLNPRLISIHATGRELQRIISDFFNTHGMWQPGVKEFTTAFVEDHRYLQAVVFEWVITLIKEWAFQEHFDGRNEHVILQCRELVLYLAEKQYIYVSDEKINWLKNRI